MSGAPAPALPFAYSDVPAEHRDWLRGRADFINAVAYRTVCDFVRIGLELAAIRTRLRRSRTFKRWVAAELPFGRQWAYKLMQIGETFGPYTRPDRDEVIDSKALVLLSRAPEGARAFALEQAADGERITLAAAREIVAAHRPVPDPDRAAVKEHEANMKPVRDAEKAARQAAGPPADDPARAARAWAMIERLAGLGGVVTVTTVDDDDDDGPPPYHVTAILPGGRRAETRRALADAVAAVLGEEQRQKCLGPCGEEKPLGEFGENRLKKGGKNPYCKVCQRSRLQKLKTAARAAAKARRAAEKKPPPGP